MMVHAPVVAIYRGGHGVLAIARTLGRLGVPVHLVSQKGMRTPVWFSRYWSSKTHWDFSPPEERSLEFLLDLGRDLGSRYGRIPVLMTLADWMAIFIEDHAETLAERFVFPKAAGAVVRRRAQEAQLCLVLALMSGATPFASVLAAI